MINLFIIDKTAPEIEKLLLPLIAFLLILLILNTLYEWLKTKPWKRIKVDEQSITEGNPEQNLSEGGDEEITRQNLKMKPI